MFPHSPQNAAIVFEISHFFSIFGGPSPGAKNYRDLFYTAQLRVQYTTKLEKMTRLVHCVSEILAVKNGTAQNTRKNGPKKTKSQNTLTSLNVAFLNQSD